MHAIRALPPPRCRLLALQEAVLQKEGNDVSKEVEHVLRQLSNVAFSVSCCSSPSSRHAGRSRAPTRLTAPCACPVPQGKRLLMVNSANEREQLAYKAHEEELHMQIEQARLRGAAGLLHTPVRCAALAVPSCAHQRGSRLLPCTDAGWTGHRALEGAAETGSENPAASRGVRGGWRVPGG